VIFYDYLFDFTPGLFISVHLHLNFCLYNDHRFPFVTNQHFSPPIRNHISITIAAVLLTKKPEICSYLCNMKASDQLHDRFVSFNKEMNLIKKNDRVLLAVSGGLDSMTMVSLFQKSLIPCAIAHCNFQLRGEAADKDQQLVERVAFEMGIPFFTTSFNTKDYAARHKISIQMAARQLRYDWLEQIRIQQRLDLIATAHHLDDSIETLFINITRGTGISGLKGIPAKSGKVVRPLLFASRSEIASYASEHQLVFREDASNAEEKYQRNRIRHQILPVLHDINPSLHTTMKEFFSVMDKTEKIFSRTIEETMKTCVIQTSNEIRIASPVLMQIPHGEVFLYEFLKAYGFSPAVCKNISENLERQPGKTFHSGSHTLLTERDELVVYPKAPPGNKTSDNPIYIFKDTKKVRFDDYLFCLELSETNPVAQARWPDNEFTTLLDYDKLTFPLTIRHWEPGDRFTPLGMSGSKKLSDLFTDSKIPGMAKKNIPVLLSAGTIAWVTGIRSSERFRISKETKRTLLITCTPNINRII
jgi:tRNA(Ile)-lysidine synthase